MKKEKSKITQAIISPLQKYVRPDLELADIQQLKKDFDILDPSQTGLVQPRDLKKALQQLGPEAKFHSFYQVVCDFDQEGGGLINFQTFVNYMNPYVTGQETQDQMKLLFGLFDDQKTGFISVFGLRRLTKQLNLDLQEEDLFQMMKQADLDEDGFVSFSEFCSILSSGINTN